MTLSVNAAANTLANGTHTGTLTLTNATSNLGSTTRSASLTAVPNGQVVLKVVTVEGDGTFRFASAASGLTTAVTTVGGTGQSAPITLNPATYTTVVTPPEGFGLTSVVCSDNDSTGNLGAKSATIALASSEVVTCTFASANSRKKTVEVITNFMSRRNDMLLSNGPDGNRQVDRLVEAGSNGGGGSGGAGFAAAVGSTDVPKSGLGMAESRLGGEAVSFGASGTAGVSGSSRGGADGRKSFEDRLSDLSAGAAGESNAQRPGLSPFEANGASEGTGRFSFSTSLSQMTRFNDAAAQRKAQSALEAPDALGVSTGSLPSGKKAFSPLDIWMQGQYISFKDDRNARDTDGHFGVVHAGVDYVVSPRVLVGAYLGYDSMHQRSASQAFDIKGQGWMAGPYATVRLSENIFLQGRAAFGRSSNTVSPFLTYSDDFSTRRMLASTALIGRWQFGNWQLRPSASISYIEDNSESYVDSLGVTIPGLRVSLGQFKAGPEVAYRHRLTDGTVLEPRIGAQLIWNFSGSDEVADFGGTLSGPDGVRGKVDLGLKAQFTNGVSLDLSTSYDGIGSSTFTGIGGKAVVRIPLN